MENKKYLDKVIGSLVRGTRIDYENYKVFFSFLPQSSLVFRPQLLWKKFLFSFPKYCKNIYGLTEEEIDYVWKEYGSIIKDKISNREP